MMPNATTRALAALVGLTLCACGGEEPSAEVTPEPAAQPAQEALEAPDEEPSPAHGGTLVTAEPYHVEVVTHDDGALEAYVASEELPSPSDAALTVRVAADDGEIVPVVMIWDPSAERFRGRLPGARHPVPGPLRVELSMGDEVATGRSSFTVILAPEEEEAVAAAPRATPRAQTQRTQTQRTQTQRTQTQRTTPTPAPAAPTPPPVVPDPPPTPVAVVEPTPAVVEPPAPPPEERPRVRVRAVQATPAGGNASTPSGSRRGRARVRVRVRED